MSAAKAKKSMKNGSYKESGQPWTTQKKGLRYYEHPTRRHGKKQDRYYAIRFKVASKDYGYGIGWWSDGIPEEIQKVDPSLGPFPLMLNSPSRTMAECVFSHGVKPINC
jgi:hypothetical protein